MTAIEVVPVTPERWPDLAALFATSSVTRGCWCMWPRTPRERFAVGAANEARLRAIAEAGTVPGLLAHIGSQPAGWCSAGPRSDYGRFFDQRGEGEVWLIACLFIESSQRGREVGSTLIRAAVSYARTQGARRVEGLPRGWRPDDDPQTMDAVLRMFRRAGFREHDEPGALIRVSLDLAEPVG